MERLPERTHQIDQALSAHAVKQMGRKAIDNGREAGALLGDFHGDLERAEGVPAGAVAQQNGVGAGPDEISPGRPEPSAHG